MIIRFGDFDLNLISGDLFRDRSLISLKPQPTRLLVALASQPGILMTRKQIRERIWMREIFIDYENGINSCVRQLRRALDDDSRRSMYVQTESRRGYRFIAPVKTLDSGGAPPALVVAQKAVVNRPVAAGGAIKLQVMPFRDISDHEGALHLAEGLSEEFLVQLAHTCGSQVAVIDDPDEDTAASRNTYILKGTVRREGARLRVTVRVMHACDRQVVRTEILERELVSVLDLQLEVAKFLAQSVGEFALRSIA
ncbi:MAG TPA: winged helix-turn-helix domain-containing protein [Bryobacteraceae bacterium]|nr:winged helix-turn-helix domain-containing protein [Bryobacteraceae bacterium]